MSDEKWVTLTPEQVEALQPETTIRACRNGTTVQGPLTSLVGEYGPDVWVGEFRVKSPAWIAVWERDVPKPDPQRLVSVEASDLEVVLDDYADLARMRGGSPVGTVARLRAALRGETS